jgi:hypothetical protein
MRYVPRILCAFPPLLLLSSYATWGAGRLALGHWPRSSLDDPKHIEGSLMWLYDVTAVLVLIGVPLFCLASLIFGLIFLLNKPEGWQHRLKELLISICLFIGFLAFSRWDPQFVVEWFFD